MFKKPALTIFAPLLEHPMEVEETKKLLEEALGETYLQLPSHQVTDPFWLDRDGKKSETSEIFRKTNPESRRLHIISGSNERHHSTYYYVRYFAEELDDLIYVHIDLHPDASLIPKRNISPGSLEYIEDGYPESGFGLGSFVHRIKEFPSVTKLIMLGYMRCWHNNYNPHVTYDHVRGPNGLRGEDFSEIFKGKNVYITIDADSQKGWAGFMMGGQMPYPSIKHNLEGIASVGNIVGIDMTGFCKTKQSFDHYKNTPPRGWDPDQFGITKLVFELTRDVLNC